jgi:hypothetical protein
MHLLRPVEVGTVRGSHLHHAPPLCGHTTGATLTTFLIEETPREGLRCMGCTHGVRLSVCTPKLLFACQQRDQNGCSDKPHAAWCLRPRVSAEEQAHVFDYPLHLVRLLMIVPLLFGEVQECILPQATQYRQLRRKTNSLQRYDAGL